MVAKKTTQALWQDYRFLTKEMIKFLTKPDMNLFYDLMNQRERLQTILDQTVNDDFKSSTEGQNLLLEIQQDNQYITDTLQSQISRSKRRHQVSEVYSGANNAPVSRMNWKR